MPKNRIFSNDMRKTLNIFDKFSTLVQMTDFNLLSK